MANLQKLQEFAADPAHPFGITNPLEHDQVVRLAEFWFPEMRFFEKEKFHPTSLDEMFSMVEDLFDTLPPAAQEAFRVAKLIRENPTTGQLRVFDPPVVTVPDGIVPPLLPVVRVLNEGISGRETLGDPAVNDSTVISHGASFTRANEFFGGKETFSGGAEAVIGDPFVPRAVDELGRPRITVLASLLNLFELLKYELLVSEDSEYPPDGLRGAIDIAISLVQPAASPVVPLSFDDLRDFLFKMIESHENGGQVPAPPLGWQLNRRAWNALTTFAFLEFDFVYAFNDFNRHETALFANEHEADDEGCCLVFDRRVLNIAATSSDPNELFKAVPFCVITSVHEEFQNADKIKLFSPPLNPSDDALARDEIEFTVYPAAGSHATYLTPGLHDLVDFQDYTSKILENPIALLFPGPLIVILIILAILEHFTDTEDETSDEGVRTGPPEVVGDHPTAVGNRLIVVPMSADNHIYGPGNEELLRLRAYTGKWGGHDGWRDTSPSFKVKTGRYFRKLLTQV